MPRTAAGTRDRAEAVTEEPRKVKAAATAEAASIRVSVDKVDRVINLVGELVITQSIVAQTIANFSLDQLPRLTEAVAQMDRHARELHERMLAVRMLPIKTLFSRFPRLVRDLTATVGKQAVLETVGEDTELDKTVIERIGDPLTHLVRNAIDHGLERPEDRVAGGQARARRGAPRGVPAGRQHLHRGRRRRQAGSTATGSLAKARPERPRPARSGADPTRKRSR